MHQGIAAALIAVGLAVAGWGFSILLSESSPFLPWVGPSLIAVGSALVVTGGAWLAWPLTRRMRNEETNTLTPTPPASTETSVATSEAANLIERGTIAHNQGQFPEALNYLQQALLITREIGDRAMEGTTLNNIGAACQAQGQYDQALNQYQPGPGHP